MKAHNSYKLVGVLVLFCAAMTIISPAQTLTTLVSFDGTNGSAPAASLIQAKDGNLYGTTEYGGPISGCEGGFDPCGTVFKITTGGKLTTLHTFVYSDGAFPVSPVVQGTDGNFYGTNQGEGDSGGAGAIFKMTSSGTLTVLSFTSSPAGLVQGSDGNFYGTTPSGGNGTVFKITPSGTLTTLHNFDGTDGHNPQAGLIKATDGNFYGTTYSGGTSKYCSGGCGTVFKMTPSGSLTTLHSFSGTDGYNVAVGLVEGTDGNLYGTTVNGGAQNVGVVYKITLSGTLTVLYSFCSRTGCTDGDYPRAGLIQAKDGNFYGTTFQGGAYDQGTVFVMTPSGSLSTLYSFCPKSGCADGANPTAGVIQASDGNFYGTTYQGGANNEGTVFKLQVNEDTLTVSVSGSGTVTSTDGYINCPGTCSHLYSHNAPVTLNAAAAGGWSFAGWSGACSGNGSCNLTMSQNQSVGATFTQNTYQLSVTTSGSGAVTSTDGFINCPGTCSHTYLSNTQVTLNATPALGWSFTAWGGACSGTGSCKVTMTQNLSASATFTQNYYTLTVSVVGSGTVTSTDGYINCPGACSHTYISLTVITLNATPESGWSFSGWTGACMGVGSCNITMTQNLFVTGVFVEPGAGIQLTPVTPCRLIDTRQGQPIQGGTSQNFIVPQLGDCGIPASSAAYSLNVTVIPRKTLNFLTIWPAGEAQPIVSLMNSPDGRVKANAAIVPAGAQGAVSVFVTDTSDLILDINGYFAAPSSATYQFYPLTPCRIIDTRGGDDGPLQKGLERDYTMAGQCGIPTTATAYSFNVTVMPTNKELDFLTVWPYGQTLPVVSTLNDVTGTVVANAAIVPAGKFGATAFYAHDNPTHLIVDVNGYFAPAGSGGYSLYAVAPCRVLDTRNNHGKPFSDMIVVNVVGSACAPPSNATAYVFNATVVPPGSMPYLTLWPDSENLPNVSTLNAYDGFVTSNMAIVPNINGSIDAYAYALTQLILDISGYFAP